MTQMRKTRFGIAAAAAMLSALACAVGPALAQDYPSKPIRIVVPFAAGSITDIIARTVGQALSQGVGQPVVIDNKPGADGAIAGLEAKRAAPDGYTLLLATNSPLSVVPHIQKQPPYDAVSDFTPISFLGRTTFFVAVHPSVPAKSLDELLAHARSNPRKVAYATGNTLAIVATALLVKHGGIDVLHVPYKSEPQAVSELVSGQTQMMLATFPTIAPHVADGKLRPVVTLLTERSALYPEVPSIVETSVPPLPIGPWAGVVGPAKLPKPIVEWLQKKLATIAANKDIKERFLRQGFAIESSTPEWLGDYIKDQLEKYGAAMRDAGIEPQ